MYSDFSVLLFLERLGSVEVDRHLYSPIVTEVDFSLDFSLTTFSLTPETRLLPHLLLIGLVPLINIFYTQYVVLLFVSGHF